MKTGIFILLPKHAIFKTIKKPPLAPTGQEWDKHIKLNATYQIINYWACLYRTDTCELKKAGINRSVCFFKNFPSTWTMFCRGWEKNTYFFTSKNTEKELAKRAHIQHVTIILSLDTPFIAAGLSGASWRDLGLLVIIISNNMSNTVAPLLRPFLHVPHPC